MSYQNHHIINQTLAQSVLDATGLNIDKAAINRINLPSTRDGARALGLPGRTGQRQAAHGRAGLAASGA